MAAQPDVVEARVAYFSPFAFSPQCVPDEYNRREAGYQLSFQVPAHARVYLWLCREHYFEPNHHRVDLLAVSKPRDTARTLNGTCERPGLYGFKVVPGAV